MCLGVNFNCLTALGLMLKYYVFGLGVNFNCLTALGLNKYLVNR